MAKNSSIDLTFSGADIEFDYLNVIANFITLHATARYFLLMVSAYSQYLKDSCKQHLALTGNYTDIRFW